MWWLFILIVTQELNHSGVDYLIGYLFICLWTIKVFFPCEIHICFCFFFLGGEIVLPFLI